MPITTTEHSATALTGNDIVDLTVPGSVDKAADSRFVNRVFHEEERRFLETQEDVTLALWLLWAAKEAAYKIVCKLVQPRPVFSHRRFRVLPGEASLRLLTQGEFFARVIWQEIETEVFFDVSAERLHAVAVWQPAKRAEKPELLAGCRKISDTELSRTPSGGTLSALSQAVRRHALPAFAEFLGVSEKSLKIDRPNQPDPRQPPRLFLDGRPAPIDISLSHHGHWVAWSACRYK